MRFYAPTIKIMDKMLEIVGRQWNSVMLGQ